MERFKSLNCMAGVLQPGDRTRYVMAVVEAWDVYNVIVLNDGFFDEIVFLKRDLSFYKSKRGDATNPWTIKAAEEMLKRFLGIWGGQNNDPENLPKEPERNTVPAIGGQQHQPGFWGDNKGGGQ